VKQAIDFEQRSAVAIIMLLQSSVLAAQTVRSPVNGAEISCVSHEGTVDEFSIGSKNYEACR
jgi:hypothetical protein